MDLCSVSSSRVSRAKEGVCILLANSLLNLGNRSENNAKKIEIENKFEFVLNQWRSQKFTLCLSINILMAETCDKTRRNHSVFIHNQLISFPFGTDLGYL